MSDGTPRTADEVGTDGSVEEQFRSLMEGLRTTLPGVEVLVAFLLTLPFQSGFTDLDQYQRGAYLVSLVAAASSAVKPLAARATPSAVTWGVREFASRWRGDCRRRGN